MYIIFWMKKKICCFFSLSICTNNINDLFNIIHVRVFYKYNYTLRWFIVFCWNYHGSKNQSYVFIFRCRFSRVYDKSGVTDNIAKAVSMFRKSYCDKYLKLYFEQVLLSRVRYRRNNMKRRHTTLLQIQLSPIYLLSFSRYNWYI